MVTDILIKDKLGRIQRRSGVPVYKQLEQNIANFINTSPDQTYFPSEREIARILNIHRKTVSRALTSFFESGRLKSTGKGSFTCRDTAQPEIHELNFMTFPLPHPERRKIRILSYENLPPMMEAWDKIIAAFEQRHSGVSVEMVYQYPKFSELGYGLFDWLANSEYDAVQLPVTLYWDRDYSRLFTENPPSFRRLLDSPEFRTKQLIGPVIPSVLKYCFPINFGTRFCSVNLELLEQAGISRPPDDFRELIRMLIERKDHLPVFLADHPENIIDMVGRGNTEPCAYTAAYRDWFGTDDPDETGLFRSSAKTVEAHTFLPFLERQVMLCPNGSGCRLQLLNQQAAFPMKHYLPLPDRGCHSHFGGNLFAVPKTSSSPEQVFEFLTSLYETTCQEIFAECGLIPARIECDPVLKKNLNGISLKEFRAFAAAGLERSSWQKGKSINSLVNKSSVSKR